VTDRSKRHTFRLFLAIWPDDEVRQRVTRHHAGWALPSGSLIYQPQDWHVTLHFLGSVADERVVEVAAGLHLPLQPCELILDQPELWRGGLAVLAATSVPSALMSFHDRLAVALRGLDLPVESRPWRPHLTLARRAVTAQLPTPITPVAWPVQKYAMVVSTGRPEQRYQVVHEYD
jgi:2'-5' RNA ligase